MIDGDLPDHAGEWQAPGGGGVRHVIRDMGSRSSLVLAQGLKTCVMLMHKKFAGYVGTRAFFAVQIAGNLTTSYV
jgi:hypothetical protein